MRTASANRGDGAGREEPSKHSTAQSGKTEFFTNNPRHLRVLIAITRRAMTREHIDTEAGASNGPELIAELRRRGLKLPCDRVPCYDRDGREVKRGVYHATKGDKRKIARFFVERSKLRG